MGSLWNKSGQIERDDNDQRTNAVAFFFIGGTNTALQVFQDAAEGIPHPQPVAASDGRWPAVFIPFTVSYDVQVKDQNNTQLYFYTGIPNPDPVDVSVTIPPEEKVQTGMMHFEFIQGTKAGYVRCNGRTVGSAASTATERANADTVALFTYLYNSLADAQAPVSGGRTGSAAADFAANKTITLPDLRRALPIGLDDMGGSAAGGFSGITFSQGNATTPGSGAGANTHTLTIAQLPTITPAGSISLATGSVLNSGSGTITYTPVGAVNNSATGTPSFTPTGTVTDHVHTFTYTTTANFSTTGGTVAVTSITTSGGPNNVSTGGNSPPFTGNAVNFSFAGNAVNFSFTGNAQSFSGTPFGSGNSHNNLPTCILGTWYMKL